MCFEKVPKRKIHLKLLHMGNLWVINKTLFESLDIEVIVPHENSKRALILGTSPWGIRARVQPQRPKPKKNNAGRAQPINGHLSRNGLKYSLLKTIGESEYLAFTTPLSSVPNIGKSIKNYYQRRKTVERDKEDIFLPDEYFVFLVLDPSL